MTALDFMVNAACVLVGAICLALAVVIVYAVAVGVYRSLKGGERNGRK